jgi:hypothetical protein
VPIEVREEFQAITKKLYTDLQGFQNLVTQMISLLDKAKTKNIEFQGVRLAMDELKKWIEENIDALEDLPRMSEGKSVELCITHKLSKNWGEVGKGFDKFNQHLHKTTHNSHKANRQVQFSKDWGPRSTKAR